MLIGTGPSLTAHQVALCQEPHRAGKLAVMGVNDAYRICPFLDVLYAGDGKWIDHHREKILASTHPEGCLFFTPDEKAAAAYPEWQFVKHKAARGISLDREVVHSGNHGGYQLINVAYLMGCENITLIGYDCRAGGQHWFGQHPEGPLRVASPFERWARGYNSIAEQAPGLNLTIVNATPGSGITAFPSVQLSEALNGFEGHTMSRQDQWKYEKAYGEMPDYRMGSARLEVVQKDILSMPAGASYLDVGCGRGETLELARKRGIDAWGVDIVPGLQNERVIDADICDLPFEDGQFDYVSCYDVLEHLPPGTEQKALDELGRVAGKQLIMTTNDKESKLPSGEVLHINRRARQAWEDDIMARWKQHRVFFSVYGFRGSEWRWRVVFQ